MIELSKRILRNACALIAFWSVLFLSLLPPNVLFGQAWYPEDAHVLLYFPQLADGGTPTQSWQTWFSFVNPDRTQTASVVLRTLADNGTPLAEVRHGRGDSGYFRVGPE
jgi:hypothetical protein